MEAPGRDRVMVPLMTCALPCRDTSPPASQQQAGTLAGRLPLLAAEERAETSVCAGLCQLSTDLSGCCYILARRMHDTPHACDYHLLW